MDKVDTVVIGAGVIGLAIARQLSLAGRSVMILESESDFGTMTSARNSEVIHAGIYYPKDSLKARLCVRGKHLLYDYCRKQGVSHQAIGKWIVACNDEQEAELESIRLRAIANGVDDLHFLDAAAARSEEPALNCQRALVSPSSGIVDAHGLMLSLLGQASEAGAMLVTRTRVAGLRASADGIVIEIEGQADPLLAESVINAAGLSAVALARRTEGLASAHVPDAYFAKGHYFQLRGRAPFRRLIYPVPEPGGLGIHLTLDLAGQARFGPDVAWVDAPDYAPDPGRAGKFERSVRRYWPGLPSDSLDPAYCGVRPKISAPGEAAADFRIDGPAVHGVAGLVNLFGIESPGLTASLAIAEEVQACLG